MSWRLELQIEDERAESSFVTLEGEGPFSIGRGSGCDLLLEEDSVSARHAELRIHDNSVQARDAQSRFGTFIESERIGEWTPLPPGRKLWIGSISIQARMRADAAPCTLRLSVPGHQALFTLLGGSSDTLSHTELSAAPFAPLGPHLPLSFQRVDGVVVALRDAQGALHRLPWITPHWQIEPISLEDSMASIAAPIPTPIPAPTDPAFPEAPSAETAAPAAPAPPLPAPARPPPAAPATTPPPDANNKSAQLPLALLLIVAIASASFGALMLWWALRT